MSETLFEYQAPVSDPAGRRYRARACGTRLDATVWEGWLEFDPLDGGDTIRSRRETTQPNRTDTEYWATGLSEVYLEGSLTRALDGPIPVVAREVRQPVFATSAPTVKAVTTNGVPTRSVIDPYSVFEKGEPLLRKQLAALSAWHLVNVILEYELSDTPADVLNVTPAPVLIDIIVRGVKQTTARR